MIYQRTIAKEVSLTGIGLHSGKKVILKMKPAESDSGIVFKRSDIKGADVLKADARSVGATENNTTLGEGHNSIHTVEHLLAALFGLGINNIYIEVNGPEIPIMDGSSASFVFILKEVGIQNLNSTKKFMILTEKVRVEHNGTWAQIEPAPNLVIDSTIVFAHPVIKAQKHTFEFSCENFLSEISRARTFGMMRDVDMLKRKGLVKGGSLDNAIVLDDFKVLNAEGLRFKDEFVRHKILDTLGDIALLGFELAGKITTYKSGHYLHNVLCRKILDNPDSYEIVSASSITQEARAAHELPQMISVLN